MIVTVSATPMAIIATGPGQNVTIYNQQFVAPNGGMSPPYAAEYSSPDYTTEALHFGIEGIVSVLAEFDSDGNFRVLRIEKGLGYGLDEKALDAIRQWRFAPAYRSGRRAGVIANIDVEFRLPQTHATKQKILDLGWGESKDSFGKAACTSCHGPEAL
jgi:TonB family protein